VGERTVVLQWEKIGSMDKWPEIEKLTGDEDYGIYQITGYHPVFGNNSLLYIGKAQKRPFATRFKEHKEWLEKEGDITIYIGRTTNIGNEDWEAAIEDTEPLLIYFHSPPYNSRSISNFPEPIHGNDLRIINIGDYGELFPEISHQGLKRDEKVPRPSDEQ